MYYCPQKVDVEWADDAIQWLAELDIQKCPFSSEISFSDIQKLRSRISRPFENIYFISSGSKAMLVLPVAIFWGRSGLCASRIYIRVQSIAAATQS